MRGSVLGGAEHPTSLKKFSTESCIVYPGDGDKKIDKTEKSRGSGIVHHPFYFENEGHK